MATCAPGTPHAPGDAREPCYLLALPAWLWLRPGVSKAVRCGLWWQWIAALASGLATLLAVSPVRALELSWSAPAECSSGADQRARVERLLTREGLAGSALKVDGTVTRDNERYRLSLRIVTSAHEAVRTVQLADCAAVDQATLALIAMALDPALRAAGGAASPRAADKHSRRAAVDAAPTGKARRRSAGKRTEPPAQASLADAGTARFDEPAPAPATHEQAPAEPSAAHDERTAEPTVESRPDAGVPAEPPASERDRARPAPEPPARAGTTALGSAAGAEVGGAEQIGAARPTTARWLSRARRWGRAGVLVGVWSAGLPAPQLDTGLRVGLARGALYGELRADWMVARSEQVDWGGEEKVRIRSFALGVAGCAAAGAWGERVRVGPCARLSLLRSDGSVTQITVPGEDRVFWLAATLSALLGVRLWSLLELSLEAGAGLPLTARPRFSVQGPGGGTAKTAELVSLHAVLGLGVRWEQKRADSSRNLAASPIGR